MWHLRLKEACVCRVLRSQAHTVLKLTALSLLLTVLTVQTFVSSLPITVRTLIVTVVGNNVG